MFFKRIEMHGFKSFADPVVVEFDKGITCVVGPNGSGKSNISDAIRWVLGEQSPKMLRGGKMEDVIFSGTQSRKSRGMAEVTLVIDNEKGKLPIDYSEVAITRRMYRSGESEYAINNNQCRMRDIRELLSDTGIGVDGYSLIGQGKISEIISNKKDSIREIFEESAGIVSYRNKKSETERKLEQTKINMDRANDIIFEIESRIDSLKDDSDRAREYLTLKDRYKDLEISLITSNLSSIEENIKTFSQDVKSLSAQIEHLEEKRSEIDKKIEESRQNLEQAKEDSKENEDELGLLVDTINSKTNENSVARERINGIENNKMRIKRELVALKEKIDEEEKNILSKGEEKEARESQLKVKESELKGREEELKEYKLKLKEQDELIRDEENKLFALVKQIEVTERESENLKELIKKLKEADKQENQDKTTKLKAFIKERENTENLFKEVQKDVEALENKIIACNDTLKDKIENKKDIENKLNDFNVKVSKDEARKKTLIEMEESYEGYQYSVKFLMNKNMRGVVGVVADLIKVEQGLELAIETALGATVQNIVVEDEQTGKWAIEELKKNRAGRATFLPLNKIKPKNIERKPLKEKGVLGYADEIVSSDEKFKDIVKFLLGSTIVVEDMDTAIAVSKVARGFKIVTKSGEVIFSTGAMSGGSIKNKVGNLFERKKEIEELGKVIEQSIKNIRECEKEIKLVESTEIDLKRELHDLEAKLSSKKGEEKNLSEVQMKLYHEIDFLEREIEDYNKSRQEIENNITETETEIKDKEALLDKMFLEKQEIEAFVARLLKGSDYNIRELDEKEQSLLDVKLAFEREKQSIDSSGQIVELILKNIENLKEEINFKENQSLNFDADLIALNEGIDRRSDEIAKLSIEKDKLIETKKNAQDSFDKYSRVYEKNILIKDEMSAELAKVKQQKYEIDIRLAKVQSQEKSLKDRLWEELEISYAEAMSTPKLDMSQSALVKENREIKSKIKALGDINLGAIKEYDEISERYKFLTMEREDIQTSLNQLREIILSMDRQIRKKFKESFDSISTNFEEIFREFFGGGVGKIEIDNIEDPLNANIDIVAQPPGKQLKNINLLSGGEKTMTAIALMFAVLKTKPTPCCILDEVEAALDDNNIHIFGNYLKRFEDIQFTLITHQKATMEHADVMYGITMPERGISKVYSLKMGEEAV